MTVTLAAVPGLSTRDLIQIVQGLVGDDTQVRTGHGGVVVDEPTAARFLALYLAPDDLPAPATAASPRPAPAPMQSPAWVRHVPQDPDEPPATLDVLEPEVLPDPAQEPEPDPKPGPEPATGPSPRTAVRRGPRKRPPASTPARSEVTS